MQILTADNLLLSFIFSLCQHHQKSLRLHLRGSKHRVDCVGVLGFRFMNDLLVWLFYEWKFTSAKESQRWRSRLICGLFCAAHESLILHLSTLHPCSCRRSPSVKRFMKINIFPDNNNRHFFLLFFFPAIDTDYRIDFSFSSCMILAFRLELSYHNREITAKTLALLFTHLINTFFLLFLCIT